MDHEYRRGDPLMPRELKPCGTVAAYKRHLRHGEDPCEACVKAYHERCVAKTQRRTQMPFEQIPHGANGYSNYGCRCETCRAAGSAKNAAYRKGRREQAREVS